MTIGQAIEAFIDQLRLTVEADKAKAGLKPTASLAHFLKLLKAYFSRDEAPLQDVTPARIRDFLARWYVEETAADVVRASFAINSQKDPQPTVEPQAMISALSLFFAWSDERAGTRLSVACSPILKELETALPRCFEIMRALSKHQAARGGPFAFPEFLTSFEQGGQSLYDLDAPGDVGAIEAYFRIIEVSGSTVRAENLITDETIEPIIFPREVARLLAPGYVINLEITRSRDGWQVTGSGAAYPPGTDVISQG
jgi:hypothetical protein